MLLIPTYVAPSQIHGVGLFAGIALPAGSTWWRFESSFDRLFTDHEFANLPQPGQRFVQEYGYRTDAGWVLSGDHDRFVNHSDNPNAGAGTILRDIQAGEEIVEDYAIFDKSFNRRTFATSR